MLLPLLACAAHASELDMSGVGGQSPLALVATGSLLPQSLKTWIPPVPELADFAPPVRVEFSLDGSQASATPMLSSIEPDNTSPSLVFLAFVMSAMIFVRYLFSERFRDLISDICCMLLAIQQDGR